MAIKKRQIVAAALTLALGSAVFVNWYFTRPEAEAASTTPENTDVAAQEQEDKNLGDAQYVSGTLANADNQVAGQESELFVSARENRQKAHDEAFDKLNQIINGTESDEASKASAREQLNMLTETIKKEADCENLIQAKIAAKCLVSISGDTAQVMVSQGGVNDTSALQIKDILIQQTGIAGENITIIESK